jgi:hypothetical protein
MARPRKSADDFAADLQRLRMVKARRADEGRAAPASLVREEEEKLRAAHELEQWYVSTMYCWDSRIAPALMVHGPYEMTEAVAVQTMLTTIYMKMLDRIGCRSGESFHASIGRAVKLDYADEAMRHGLEDKAYPEAGIRYGGRKPGPKPRPRTDDEE